MLFYFFISVFAINRNHNYYCFLVVIFVNFLKNFFRFFFGLSKLLNSFFRLTCWDRKGFQISLLITLIFDYPFLILLIFLHFDIFHSKYLYKRINKI